MIEKLCVQAYSIRQYYNEEGATVESVTEVFKQIKAMGYDEVQSADYGKLTREQYAEAAHAAGLAIIGTHENYYQIRDNTEEMMRIHEEVFGTKIMGVGGMFVMIPIAAVLYTLLLKVLGFAEILEDYAEMGAVMTVAMLIMGNITFFLLDRLLSLRFGAPRQRHGR